MVRCKWKSYSGAGVGTLLPIMENIIERGVQFSEILPSKLGSEPARLSSKRTLKQHTGVSYTEIARNQKNKTPFSGGPTTHTHTRFNGP